MPGLIMAYPRHTVYLRLEIIFLTVKAWFRFNPSCRKNILEFEQRFAEYVGSEYAICAPSARAAFYLILKSFGYPAGSEIILSDYNFPPIVSIIIDCGLSPVFTDIDPLTLNIDTDAIEEKISPKTKAILVTHIFGNPCDMDAIQRIAKKYKLDVIEDCAHSFGSKWRNIKVGSLGDAAFFSLSLGKNIFCFGGGVITTSNAIIAERIRKQVTDISVFSPIALLKNTFKMTALYIISRRPFFNFFVYPFLNSSRRLWDIIEARSNEGKFATGMLFRQNSFSQIQAEVGLYQLSRIDDYIMKKQRIIRYLDANLSGFNRVGLQHTLPPAENNKLYYVIYSKTEADCPVSPLRRRMLRAGVDTQMPDMHSCSVLSEFKDYAAKCPNARRLAPGIFEIPSDTSLKQKDLDWIIRAVKASFR